MEEIPFSAGRVYPDSIVQRDGSTYFLVRLASNNELRLGVNGDPRGFDFTETDGNSIALCPLSAANAALLRQRLPWLNPQPLGLHSSYGFGDRIGNATPGHIRALRACQAEEKIAPIFAQQSVRENSQTGRTPQQVIDAAMWGVFLSGWRKPWGADADHLKGVGDLEPFLNAGYTFFTIDPTVHVDDHARDLYPDELQAKMAELPWEQLDSSYKDMQSRYLTAPFQLDGLELVFDELTMQRALAKFAHAIAHSRAMAEALVKAKNGEDFDLEISVDETPSPTSVHEHFLFVNEIKRLGLPVNCLALHFVGKFQRGVDYIGDTDEFEQEFIQHAAVMRYFGTYKLSIHTGSDKLSLYPIIAQHAGRQIHVKTSGTSYLEGLRVLTYVNPKLFRAILELARAHYDREKKAYSVDARLDKVPTSNNVKDKNLPDLLDQFDPRQVLHISFGLVIGSFGDQIIPWLDHYEEEFWTALEGHFAGHLEPFALQMAQPALAR